ncbi:MAG: hypothetical protein WD651_02555 [Acidimicrobiia bacterium]
MSAGSEVKEARALVEETERQLAQARARASELEQGLKNGDLEITEKSFREARGREEYLVPRLEGAKRRFLAAEGKLTEERSDVLYGEMQEALAGGLVEMREAVDAFQQAGSRLIGVGQRYASTADELQARWRVLLPEGASADNRDLPAYLARFTRFGVFGNLDGTANSPTTWDVPAIPLALVAELLEKLPDLTPKWRTAVRSIAGAEITHELEKLRRVLPRSKPQASREKPAIQIETDRKAG